MNPIIKYLAFVLMLVMEFIIVAIGAILLYLYMREKNYIEKK